MIRLIHSFDWQLGARFRQFGSVVKRLSDARIEPLKRTLEATQRHLVDAFLILSVHPPQIRLFTCHPDRYRGVGQAITLPA